MVSKDFKGGKDKDLDVLFPPPPPLDDEDDLLDDEDFSPPARLPDFVTQAAQSEEAFNVLAKSKADVAAMPKFTAPEPDPLTQQLEAENPKVKKLDVDPDREELARYFMGDILFKRVKLLATGRGVSVGTMLDQGLQMCFDIGGFICVGASEYKRSARDDAEHYFVNKRLRALVGGLSDQVLAACRAYGVSNKEGFAAGIEAALDRGAI